MPRSGSRLSWFRIGLTTSVSAISSNILSAALPSTIAEFECLAKWWLCCGPEAKRRPRFDSSTFGNSSARLIHFHCSALIPKLDSPKILLTLSHRFALHIRRSSRNLLHKISTCAEVMIDSVALIKNMGRSGEWSRFYTTWQEDCEDRA